MSNLHILETPPNRMRFVIHVAVASANNSAGINWRTVLVRSGIGGKTILPDGDGTGGTISAAEKAEVLAGSIYEAVLDEKTWPTSNAELDALFNTRRVQILADLQNRLKYYGATR